MMFRVPPSFRRFPGLLIALLAVLASPTVVRAGWFADDQGFYRVYQADHLLGTERITFEERNDSSVVVSMIGEVLPRPGSPPDTVRKNAILAVSSRDGALRGYQSHENVNGK